MTARSVQKPVAIHDSKEQSKGFHECCSAGRRVGHRLFVLLSVVLVTISTFSRPAGAHGEAGHSGTPVTFAVVVGFPIVVGLVAGLMAIAIRTQNRVDQRNQYSRVVFGLLFVFLGGTFVIEAATRSFWLAFAGGTAGGIGVLWITAHDETTQRADVCHAELTCGAISIHRLLEGLAVGTLYSTGAVAGIFGAITIAGHTGLETGVLGGQYTSYRLGAIGAISLVQISYAVGAIVGTGFTMAISMPIQSAVLALAGGIVCTIGINETRSSNISPAARLA